MNGVAGFCLKPAHHVVFADIKLPGQAVNRLALRQVQIQILENGDDLFVTGGGGHILQLTRLQIPGDGNQKLGHQGLVQQLLAVAWGRLGVPQSLQQPDDPDLPVRAEHIAVFLRRQTETTAQVCLRRRGLLEKLRGNV